jgi:hypothetical protein
MRWIHAGESYMGEGGGQRVRKSALESDSSRGCGDETRRALKRFSGCGPAKAPSLSRNIPVVVKVNNCIERITVISKIVNNRTVNLENLAAFRYGG